MGVRGLAVGCHVEAWTGCGRRWMAARLVPWAARLIFGRVGVVGAGHVLARTVI
jgi:hypothetical protein